MTDLPANVIGISGEGRITGKDYETILIPAVENRLKTNKKLSLLYHLGSDYKGYDLAAIADDSKIGMKHLFAWEKIALVSDHELLNIVAKFFGYMLPCEVRIFKNDALEDAKKWIIS
jgi:hypothetical protein